MSDPLDTSALATDMIDKWDELEGSGVTGGLRISFAIADIELDAMETVYERIRTAERRLKKHAEENS